MPNQNQRNWKMATKFASQMDLEHYQQIQFLQFRREKGQSASEVDMFFTILKAGELVTTR
jgi:hypothetical protein